MYQLRPMQATDVAAIMHLQTFCYAPNLWETEQTVRQRLDLAPNECWVAEDAQGLCAYLFGYRSRLGCVTALDAVFTPVANGDCYYLHDLAVLPRMKGQGVGQALVNQALTCAQQQGIRSSALVSVQDSAAFWGRLGYRPMPVNDPEHADNLASYQTQAIYMSKAL